MSFPLHIFRDSSSGSTKHPGTCSCSLCVTCSKHEVGNRDWSSAVCARKRYSLPNLHFEQAHSANCKEKAKSANVPLVAICSGGSGGRNDSAAAGRLNASLERRFIVGWRDAKHSRCALITTFAFQAQQCGSEHSLWPWRSSQRQWSCGAATPTTIPVTLTSCSSCANLFLRFKLEHLISVTQQLTSSCTGEYAEFIGHRQSGLRALINPAESELVGGGGREAVHVRAFNSRSVPPSASALAHLAVLVLTSRV